jgi:hypothetical protein
MAHIHLRRVMAQHVGLDPLDHVTSSRIRDIGFVTFRLGIEIVPLSGRKIIHNMNFVAALDVRIDNVRGDESGASGNDDSHVFSP